MITYALRSDGRVAYRVGPRGLEMVAVRVPAAILAELPPADAQAIRAHQAKHTRAAVLRSWRTSTAAP